MATPTQLAAASGLTAVVRMGQREFEVMRSLLRSRYPEEEWATFLRFGYRETARGLILSVAHVDAPVSDDLDMEASHVVIREPYSLRIALSANDHPLALGIIHSHPLGCAPHASSMDDDMDSYYGNYFSDFADDRPFASLIYAEIGDAIWLSGRVLWRGSWRLVSRFIIEGVIANTWEQSTFSAGRKRRSRLADAFGADAEIQLKAAKVAVIGAGGTGSAAIEVLARAGVGHLVLVDPDSIEESNLERIHGSEPHHAQSEASKVVVARDHVLRIDSECRVDAIIGSLPQSEVVDYIASADVLLGCTDKQHSRLALSDIAVRFSIPSIDCGVALEGNDGRITGQVVQLVHFSTFGPCAICQGLINWGRISQELMTESERIQRQAAAKRATVAGVAVGAYWQSEPQLNTVGYLTTLAGSMIAAYAIGAITGRFTTPFQRMQLNLSDPTRDVHNIEVEPRLECTCRRLRGWSDQGQRFAPISTPEHWLPAKIV